MRFCPTDSQPEHILDKQIRHRQNQSDTKQQQPEGHASGDHHVVFTPLLMHQRQFVLVILLFSDFYGEGADCRASQRKRR